MVLAGATSGTAAVIKAILQPKSAQELDGHREPLRTLAKQGNCRYIQPQKKKNQDGS